MKRGRSEPDAAGRRASAGDPRYDSAPTDEHAGQVVRFDVIQITETIAIEEREIDERFVRASGPGGQNVNKVATAVELRFDIRASSLPAEVKERLERVAGRRVVANGVLLIDSREYRTQGQNREAALRRLIALIRRAASRPKTRRPTRPSAAARERRITAKKRRSNLKDLRRRRPHEE